MKRCRWADVELGGAVSIGVIDRKHLWTRAHNQCAFPSCPQVLSDDLADSGGEAASTPIVVGEEAHIRSSRVDGPRHDENYNPALLDTYDNLILLCPTHHTYVDKDKGRGFSIADLIRMRRSHERHTATDARLEQVYRAYLADQYEGDDKVLFEAVDLHGPTVDSMFVDVPIAAPRGTPAGELIASVHDAAPVDVEARDASGELAIAGGSQVLLNPGWTGNALIQGGPGQGKSTLLQFVCQYHRSRLVDGKDDRYTGADEGLRIVTSVARLPIRVDLRQFAAWLGKQPKGQKKKNKPDDRSRQRDDRGGGLDLLSVYLADHIRRRSGQPFSVADFVTTLVDKSVLIALDGLDEVAQLADRDAVAEVIRESARRLHANASDLVILVATRPGATDTAKWAGVDFPVLTLRPVSVGLKVQYLQKWCKQAGVSGPRTEDLRNKLIENQDVAHVRELGSNPMQLAILLHLLYRRGLLPQQRTELYQEYVKTFLDREEQDKEPLVHTHRQVILQVHAYLAWHLQSQAEVTNSDAGALSRTQLREQVNKLLADSSESLKFAEDLFNALTSRVLCLVERQTGFFEFEVQSLREYFAALYVFDESPSKGTKNSRDDCLSALIERPYWSNVTRFLVGMLSKGEVKALIDNLESRQGNPDAKLDPYLRMVANQLLDDRVYENQPDRQVMKTVEFILEGPGVVLGEDGLLDGSGGPIQLGESAGAKQVIELARGRLGTYPPVGLRLALTGALRRHDRPLGNATWAWDQAGSQVAPEWLPVLADLGAFRGATDDQVERVLDAATSADESTEPLVPLLVRGQYDGRSLRVIDVALAAALDGALDRVNPIHFKGIESDLRSMTALGTLDFLRDRPVLWAGTPAGPSRGRRPRKRTRNGSTVHVPTSAAAKAALVLEAAASLRADPTKELAWRGLVTTLSEQGGDSWLLRVVITAIPTTIDLSLGSDGELAGSATWRSHVAWVREARANATDSEWWAGALPDLSDQLALRHWALGVLTLARTTAVLHVKEQLEAVVGRLTLDQFHALHGAVSRYARSPQGRELNLRDSLRRGTLEPTPRLAALLAVGATSDSQSYLNNRVAEEAKPFADSLGYFDRGILRRHLEGADLKLAVEDFEDTRGLIPSGSKATSRLSPNYAHVRRILEEPHRWPSDLVATAARRLGARRTENLPPLAQVAEDDNWFED